MLIEVRMVSLHLENFEKKKNAFINENAPAFIDAKWDALTQSFVQYANAINNEDTNKQEDHIDLTQLPDEGEFQAYCLNEEQSILQRMIGVLGKPDAIIPPSMLIIKENRPILPMLDYYQILLLWRNKRYQDVERLCLKVLNHIDQIHWYKQPYCPLIPYYTQRSDAYVEKYLHPMINHFSLSEIYYYCGKSKQALNKTNSKSYMAVCYYFRSRNCLGNDLLQEAKIYIDKAMSFDILIHFKGLQDFVEFLIKDQKNQVITDDNSPSQEYPFLKNNLKFCLQYSHFLTQQNKVSPKFLTLLSQEMNKSNKSNSNKPNSNKRMKLSLY